MIAIKQGAPKRPGKVLVLGCFPPRKCGIATFTHDTVEALRSADRHLSISVIAMNDGAQPDNPGKPVIASLRDNDLGAYIDAAAVINTWNPDCVLIQHEFGIFGGPAGEYLLALLALIKVPVITIFHTVLETPNSDQLRVMRRIVHRSAKLVVMAQRGASMLRDTYGAPLDKVTVIPHGAPVRPYAEPDDVRAKLGLDCEPMLSTFGLLSPNKGIENVIRAMPDVLAAFPSARYVVLGVTHPHLLAREGEAYRTSLEDLADSLGVAGSVQFINRFVENAELFDYLQASDVYVTPYLNQAQITSGTLSYALALGCFVVSTPYWHAREALAECPGDIVAISDPAAISAALLSRFHDPETLSSLRRKVYQWAEPTRWPIFGQRLLGLITEATRAGHRAVSSPDRRPPAFPATAMKAIDQMTDSCGIFQHSRFAIPDRAHGYCVDDNARALILCNDLIRRRMSTPEIERLHRVYASFVLHAFDEATGLFRNFMDYNRNWTDAEPSQDSQGRTFWALGHAAATVQFAGNTGWASTILQQCFDRIRLLTSPRSKAFVILGCAELMQSPLADDRYDQLMQRFSGELFSQLTACQCADWNWLEDTTSYDNGRIPQAMIAAARLGGDSDLAGAALAALAWLCDIQRIDHGMFCPVGSDSFGRSRQLPHPYDQQPIEAAAMLDAYLEAYKLTHDRIWWRRARTVISWFYGQNMAEVSLVNPSTGHCHDGLNASGLNLNGGAESLLAFQMALVTYQAFLELVEAEATVVQRPLAPLAVRA